jgi:hypothetical protein
MITPLDRTSNVYLTSGAVINAQYPHVGIATFALDELSWRSPAALNRQPSQWEPTVSTARRSKRQAR